MELAWNLFVELRKELTESQKLRSQVFGFKITFVSAGIGIIITHLEELDPALLVVPALAAIFFDLLIVSYSFSVKRIGSYCRDHLEPVLREASGGQFQLWQEFLETPGNQQNFSILGNIGLTVVAVVAGAIALFFPFRPLISSVLLAVLLLFVSLAVWAYRNPKKFRKNNKQITPAAPP